MILICLDPALDRSSRTREASKKSLLSLGKKLHDCQLMDVWRVHHPKEMDYSFFLGSALDLFKAGLHVG